MFPVCICSGQWVSVTAPLLFECSGTDLRPSMQPQLSVHRLSVVYMLHGTIVQLSLSLLIKVQKCCELAQILALISLWSVGGSIQSSFMTIRNCVAFLKAPGRNLLYCRVYLCYHYRISSNLLKMFSFFFLVKIDILKHTNEQNTRGVACLKHSILPPLYIHQFQGRSC